MEISGAMGDLGTYIPIVVALSIQCVARQAHCVLSCTIALAGTPSPHFG